MSLEKKIIAGILLITLIGLGVWFYLEARPKPGELTKDLGREHVPIGTPVEYATNPPTSGPHYEDWTRWGVYDKVLDDRNLVHSLEHGYVIISYNCDIPLKTSNLGGKVYAQEMNIRDVLLSTPSAEATSTVKLSDKFKSSDCKELVKNLSDVYNDKGKKRIIVIPRPNMDSRIALTAWRRLEKLDNFDKEKINYFIDTLINEGPEKTME